MTTRNETCFGGWEKVATKEAKTLLKGEVKYSILFHLALKAYICHNLFQVPGGDIDDGVCSK
jgi:hypothetical protein